MPVFFSEVSPETEISKKKIVCVCVSCCVTCVRMWEGEKKHRLIAIFSGVCTKYDGGKGREGGVKAHHRATIMQRPQNNVLIKMKSISLVEISSSQFMRISIHGNLAL